MSTYKKIHLFDLDVNKMMVTAVLILKLTETFQGDSALLSWFHIPLIRVTNHLAEQ